MGGEALGVGAGEVAQEGVVFSLLPGRLDRARRGALVCPQRVGVLLTRKHRPGAQGGELQPGGCVHILARFVAARKGLTLSADRPGGLCLNRQCAALCGP